MLVLGFKVGCEHYHSLTVDIDPPIPIICINVKSIQHIPCICELIISICQDPSSSVVSAQANVLLKELSKIGKILRLFDKIDEIKSQ